MRNYMTLTVAVLNNIPAVVVVVNENDRVIIDNLAYKILYTDCGGQELLMVQVVLDYHNGARLPQ
ncbi:MAG: hypothetical protein ACR5K7_02270 [Symbiopectobacterium sp.]